jgi:hypothetical protein
MFRRFRTGCGHVAETVFRLPGDIHARAQELSGFGIVGPEGRGRLVAPPADSG